MMTLFFVLFLGTWSTPLPLRQELVEYISYIYIYKRNLLKTDVDIPKRQQFYFLPNTVTVSQSSAYGLV